MMRYVIAALLAALSTGVSAAENPDGPVGGMWVDVSGVYGRGDWRFPHPWEGTLSDEGDREVATIHGELGVIAGEWVSFAFIGRFSENRSRKIAEWAQEFGPSYFGDHVEEDFGIGVRFKLWLRK